MLHVRKTLFRNNSPGHEQEHNIIVDNEHEMSPQELYNIQTAHKKYHFQPVTMTTCIV